MLMYGKNYMSDEFWICSYFSVTMLLMSVISEYSV